MACILVLTKRARLEVIGLCRNPLGFWKFLRAVHGVSTVQLSEQDGQERSECLIQSDDSVRAVLPRALIEERMARCLYLSPCVRQRFLMPFRRPRGNTTTPLPCSSAGTISVAKRKQSLILWDASLNDSSPFGGYSTSQTSFATRVSVEARSMMAQKNPAADLSA